MKHNYFQLFINLTKSSLLTFIVFLFLSCSPTTSEQSMILDRINANQIYVISDGDMYGQSYLGSELPKYSDPNFKDSLTGFYKNNKSFDKTSVFVSNSVVGTPEIFAISPKGDYILVVETKKQRSKKIIL